MFTLVALTWYFRLGYGNTVFNLYVIDGYSHKEIADMLEITTGTSKSNLARARMILKEKIEKLNGNQKLPSA